jgi:hypothetical protein
LVRGARGTSSWQEDERRRRKVGRGRVGRERSREEEEESTRGQMRQGKRRMCWFQLIYLRLPPAHQYGGAPGVNFFIFSSKSKS